MGQLHELLAVENDLGNKFKSVYAKIISKFGDVSNYIGQRRRYTPLIDGGQPFPADDKILPSRVPQDLDEILEVFGNWSKASIQKEITNTKTNGDIIVDGIELGSLPTPALLNLESKLGEFGKALKSIPTYDPAYRWNWSGNEEAYVAESRTTYRTEKKLKTHVQYEATNHHPAQVQTYSEDVIVGEWETTIISGAIAESTKKDLIERWEKLFLAVKVARQKANQCEVEDYDISPILNYLRG